MAVCTHDVSIYEYYSLAMTVNWVLQWVLQWVSVSLWVPLTGNLSELSVAMNIAMSICECEYYSLTMAVNWVLQWVSQWVSVSPWVLLTGDGGDAGALEQQEDLTPAHSLHGVAEEALPRVQLEGLDALQQLVAHAQSLVGTLLQPEMKHTC